MDHQSATTQPVSAGRTLEETSPCFGWGAFWGNTLLTEIVLLLFPGALVLGATWPRWDGAAIGLAIAALLALPVALLCAWSQNRYLRKKSGSVTFSNGLLTTVVNSDMHSVPLDRCRWYYGNSTRATVPDLGDLPVIGVRTILIELPPEYQTDGRTFRGDPVPAGPIVVAVGFSQESRRAWLEVFEESGALHDTERERVPSPLSSLTLFLSAFVSIPVIVMGVGRAARAIDHWLQELGVAEDIACAATKQLVIPGLFFVFGYVVLFVLLYKRRCSVTPEQRAAAVEPMRPYKVWFLIILVWGAIGPLSRVRTQPVASLVDITVTLVLTGLVMLHFHLLLKDRRMKSSD